MKGTLKITKLKGHTAWLSTKFIQTVACNSYSSTVHKRKDDYKRKTLLELLVVPKLVTFIFPNMQKDLTAWATLRIPYFTTYLFCYSTP
jgi:hypothetical protein